MMGYLSRIRLKPGLDLAQLAKVLPSDAYAEHRLIWQWFGEDAEARDFLFRREQQDHWPVFYVLSRREPIDKKNLWNIETRAFAPNLASGERLAFALRANPVRVRKISDDPAIKTRRRDDVVADLKKHRYSNPEQRPPLASIVQEAGEPWLVERGAKFGFEIESVHVDGYRQQRLYKPGTAKPIMLSTLEFTGTLRILDAGQFVEGLFQGIGPAKAFGCGLLLVRRA
jgi:CRISPR system Cascade subunit CasE